MNDPILWPTRFEHRWAITGLSWLPHHYQYMLNMNNISAVRSTVSSLQAAYDALKERTTGNIHVYLVYIRSTCTRLSFGMWLTWNPGGKHLEKREHRRSCIYMSLFEIRGVVPLLLLHRCCTARVLLHFRACVGWNRPTGCAQVTTPNAHARIPGTHVGTVRSYRTADPLSKAYGVIHVPSEQQIEKNTTRYKKTAPSS